MESLLKFFRWAKALWTRKNLRRAAVVLGAVVLLTPPLFIAQWLSQGDRKLENAVRSLAELKRIDAAWSADSLRLSAGLIADYDPLTKPLPQVALHEATLHALMTCTMNRGEDAPADLPLLFERYRDAMARKIGLLERIKSQQSILGNSLRFLPTAHAELAESAKTMKNESGPQVLELINRLLVAGMNYQREPRQELRDTMDGTVRRLQSVTAGWDEVPAGKVDAVAMHTRLVLEQRQLGDALLKQLLAVPIGDALDAMEHALQVRKDALSKRQERYKLAIVAYGGLLLTALGVAGWLLARSYRKLNESYASLREANDEAQLQLVQSAKMAAMGRMAAGLAHEINTPLAYVRATMAVLKEKLVDGYLLEADLAEEMSVLFEDGLYGIDQISTLVLTLKNFTRLDQARVGEFSVEEGLDSSLLLARYTIKHVAQVRKIYGNVPRVSCSPAQINQVFLNIIVNASHAMACREGKGLLEVRTSEENGFVKVQIQDNGHGIPKHVLPRIFDPFFTTKKIGEGSGTGLALAYRIVQSHGGKIKVDTEEGVGTTFTVLLPIQSTAETQAALRAEPQPA